MMVSNAGQQQLQRLETTKTLRQHTSLQKLKAFGLPDFIVRWMSPFLRARQQQVKLSETFSDWLTLNGGMPKVLTLPQGSYLGLPQGSYLGLPQGSYLGLPQGSYLAPRFLPWIAPRFLPCPKVLTWDL